MLWPVREDAEEYLHRQGHAADCTVDFVDVLLFLHMTEAAPNSDFQIFPTEKDAFSMSGKALQEALETEEIFSFGGNLAVPINLVKQELYQLIVANKLGRGLRFDPVIVI